MAYQPPHFPAYGYCDSYFVDNHDDDEGVYARAAAERERQRGLAKLRQKALAEELSRATVEYQDDILDHMEHMEAETMPDIQSIEIQTEIQWFMRPYLLDFLLEAHHLLIQETPRTQNPLTPRDHQAEAHPHHPPNPAHLHYRPAWQKTTR